VAVGRSCGCCSSSSSSSAQAIFESSSIGFMAFGLEACEVVPRPKKSSQVNL
jgi:hypothetical protein